MFIPSNMFIYVHSKTGFNEFRSLARYLLTVEPKNRPGPAGAYTGKLYDRWLKWL